MGFLILCLILIQLQLPRLDLSFAGSCANGIECNNSHGNYTSGSPYSTNLQKLLTTITSSEINYNFSIGLNSDKVYGIGVCGIEIPITECHNCIGDLASSNRENCPTQKEATTTYSGGDCMLGYSDRSMFGFVGDEPSCTLPTEDYTPSTCPDDSSLVTHGKRFNPEIENLLDQLTRRAAEQAFPHKAARAYANVNGMGKIYGVLQCNPYLSSSDCSNCLRRKIQKLRSCFNLNTGKGRIYGLTCSLEVNNNWRSDIQFDPISQLFPSP